MQTQLRARQAELLAELMHIEAELAKVRVQHHSIAQGLYFFPFSFDCFIFYALESSK